MKTRYILIISMTALLGWALHEHREASGKPTKPRATITGTVKVTDSTANNGRVVVYLDSARALERQGKPIVHTITQRDRQFTPALTVIPKGGTIEFPNNDRVFHNVFSLSRAKRFDLGLYRDGDSRSVTFKRTGVIDVYCNIHPEMVAQIVVVPNTYYAITNSKGQFQIPNVPSGTYTLVAWNGSEARTRVVVGRKHPNSITLELGTKPKAQPHLRKEGTPYPRYR